MGGGGKLSALGGSRMSLLAGQSSQSGAKLVSDWTYLPLPSGLNRQSGGDSGPAFESLERQPENASGTWETDLYQVLSEAVGPNRRNLPPPMWDPLIFVPPERRHQQQPTDFKELLAIHQQPWIRSSKLKAEEARKTRMALSSSGKKMRVTP